MSLSPHHYLHQKYLISKRRMSVHLIHIAVDANNKLAFGKLIEHGVYLDIQDNARFLPLDYAKFKGWSTEEFVNNEKNTKRFIKIKAE